MKYIAVFVAIASSLLYILSQKEDAPVPIAAPVSIPVDPGQRLKSVKFLEGVRWAENKNPTSASACDSDPSGQISRGFTIGCRAYFFGRLSRPGLPETDGPIETMNTAECQAKVRPQAAAFFSDMKEITESAGDIGNDVLRYWRPELTKEASAKYWDPALKNCDILDANTRLQNLMNKMKMGWVVSQEERNQMQAEFNEVSLVGEMPFKAIYLGKTADYYECLRVKDAPKQEYPKISCAEYQTRIDEVLRRKDEHEANETELKAREEQERQERNNAVPLYQQSNKGMLVGDNRKTIRNNEASRKSLIMWLEWKFLIDGGIENGCNFKRPEPKC